MENASVAESRHLKKFSRFFRFRLRSLLLVFTIIGVFVGPELYYQGQQHDAAKRLRSLPHTSLAYDYDIQSDDDWADKFPPIRSQVSGVFHRTTGSHFFSPVVRLFLSDDSAESISLVGKLGNLKWLHIANSTGSLNDREIASLKPIQNCSKLEYLVVGNWLTLNKSGSEGFRGTGTILLPYDIADTDIETISKLNDLRVLAVGGQNVDDNSLQKLADINSLQYLYLSRANVTQNGISGFHQKRPDVEVIELADPNVDYSIEISDRF